MNPTGNLDPDTSEHVFATLLDLVRSTGLSAVIATHNLDLAARMDRNGSYGTWQTCGDLIDRNSGVSKTIGS